MQGIDQVDASDTSRGTHAGDSYAEKEKTPFDRFARDSLRQSLGSNNMYKWLEAQSNQEARYHQVQESKGIVGNVFKGAIVITTTC